MSQVAQILTMIFITSMLLTLSGTCDECTGTQLLNALNVYDSSTNEWTGNDITLGSLFGDFFDTTVGKIATIGAAAIFVGTFFSSSPQGYLLAPVIISLGIFINDIIAVINYVQTPFLKAIIGILSVSFAIYYIFALVRFWYGND